MRILVQGAGSIGQRHYRNILTLGHEAAFLRTTKERRPFIQKFFDEEAREGREPKEFQSLEEAVQEWGPHAIVIATPNHLHLSNALAAAKQDLSLLIEKPVHDSSDGLAELSQLIEEHKLTAMVGYNLRFHPLLKRVKGMVESNELGTVLSIFVEVGENIEDWHPWEDYRDTYAPAIATGGGALLCFSHDIDYLFWLFGAPTSIEASGGKVTPLAGDAEDMVQSLWSYDDGKTALVHIDYFQRPKVRTLKIIGTERTVVWDAYAALTIIEHATGEQSIEHAPEGFERNDMFVEELKHFISCVEEGTRPLVPVSDGQEVVRIIEIMKEKLV